MGKLDLFMFSMAQKVFKTGNSLAVTIPAGFVRSVGVRPGDLVKTHAKPESGGLIFVFSGTKQLALLEGISFKKKLFSKKNEKV